MTATPSPWTPEQERMLNRYGNTRVHGYARRYAAAYIAWLKGGAVGAEPDRTSGLSKDHAARMRAEIAGLAEWTARK